MIKDRERLFYELVKEDFLKNQSFGYMSQMAVLTIKSLMPQENELGNRINYTRYIKELDLWTYYKSDYNQSLLNIKKMDEDIYWNAQDDSLISRIIPIIITNDNMDLIMDETIKNILFTSGNLGSLFEYMMIAYLIKLMMDGLDHDHMVDEMKEYIIKFGQNDFIDRYSKYYRCDLESYPGKIKIDFEKEKINIINILNDLYMGKSKVLEECLELSKNSLVDCKSFESRLLNRFINGSGEDKKVNIPNFYIGLGKYMDNLNKGRISAKDLYIEKYELPDIFKFDEGDKFFHTLLNDSEVVKKKENENIISLLIRSKSGYYAFNKRK